MGVTYTCKRRSSRRLLMKFYIVSVVMVVIVICLQHRQLVVKQFYYQSNIYKTTWNVRFYEMKQSMTVSANYNETYTWQRNGSLYHMTPGNVTIFSAIGRNTSSGQQWDELVLSGWEGFGFENFTYDCCIIYNRGKLAVVKLKAKLRWYYCRKCDLMGTQFICHNPGGAMGLLPRGVSLIPEGGACAAKYDEYVYPSLPVRMKPNSIAICAKIAYGSLSPNRIIEWYEIHRHFQVDKVITYMYNLSQKATEVLQHYAATGFVELYEFDYPAKDTLPRKVGDKKGQVFVDEQIATYDCVERLSGYTFVGILDHDEYLVPTPSIINNWPMLLRILMRRHSNASGFSFRTEIFPTDWDKANLSGEFLVTQYLDRTRPMWDRRKNIFLSDRVVPGSVWTHNYTSIPGYEKIMISSGMAALKHYRSCRQEWVERNNCYSKRRRYRDTKMVSLLSSFNHSIKTLQRELLGTENATPVIQ